jgi:hypothetical protein
MLLNWIGFMANAEPSRSCRRLSSDETNKQQTARRRRKLKERRLSAPAKS